jgi:hypothetical protein
MPSSLFAWGVRFAANSATALGCAASSRSLNAPHHPCVLPTNTRCSGWATLLSPAWKRCRQLLTRLWQHEEFRHFHPQRPRNLHQESGSRVLQPPLQSDHVRPVYSRVHGKRLLRDKAHHSEPPDVPCDEGARIHQKWKAACGLLIHGLWTHEMKVCSYRFPRFFQAARPGGDPKRQPATERTEPNRRGRRQHAEPLKGGSYCERNWLTGILDAVGNVIMLGHPKRNLGRSLVPVRRKPLTLWPDVWPVCRGPHRLANRDGCQRVSP